MRDFTKTKRIVIKVGTNVLTCDNSLDGDFLEVIARQISELLKQNRQVILVSSGAIGMGAAALGITQKIKDVKMRQACAAIGQGLLMHKYHEAFSIHRQKVAQVLLTNQLMTNRKLYLNLKNAVETLLSLKIVPIINENDCVSIEEIDLAFGDNDRLSALVASKIDAELLLLLSDVAGLYDRNPRKSSSARLIPIVYELTPEIEAMADKAGTTFSTGGMKSKLNAVRIAAQSGCRVVLAHGREANVILRVVNGEQIGTLFLPKRRLSNRKRWILNTPASGHIDIDTGAAEALHKRRSLLWVGITNVSGSFDKESVVEISNFAKGICSFSSTRLRQMLTQKKQNQKPPSPHKAVVHADNLVLFD